MREWIGSGAFSDEVGVEGKYPKCFAGFCTDQGWLVSVNNLESESASGVVFAGVDGDLSYRLDWWAGVGYYDSSGRDDRGAGHTGEMLGWECVTRGRGVSLEGDLNDVVGVRALEIE